MTSDLYKLYLFIYLWISQTGVSSPHEITVCENTNHNITCDGGVIQVNNASYGRHDTDTCPYWTMTSTSCHASDSQPVVQGLCNGISKCILKADKAQFSQDDGCHYEINRYLTVRYTCSSTAPTPFLPTQGSVPTPQIIVTICDGNTEFIDCNEGTTIEILYASYGRHDNRTCPSRHMTNTNCHSPESFSIVKDMCGGKKTCAVFPGIFESDPCPGTFKYLFIDYNCVHQIKDNNVNENYRTDNNVNENYRTGMFKLELQISNVQVVGDLITSRKSGSLIECLSRDCVTNGNCNSAIFDPLSGICHTFTSPSGNSSKYQLSESEEIWRKG